MCASGAGRLAMGRRRPGGRARGRRIGRPRLPRGAAPQACGAPPLPPRRIASRDAGGGGPACPGRARAGRAGAAPRAARTPPGARGAAGDRASRRRRRDLPRGPTGWMSSSGGARASTPRGRSGVAAAGPLRGRLRLHRARGSHSRRIRAAGARPRRRGRPGFRNFKWMSGPGRGFPDPPTRAPRSGGPTTRRLDLPTRSAGLSFQVWRLGLVATYW